MPRPPPGCTARRTGSSPTRSTRCKRGISSGRLFAGSSGFSYPSWKGSFYAADAKPDEFLRLYAERLPSVELNNTFYRLPAEGQFERWAAAVPSGFHFAVTMSRQVTAFGRVRGLDAFEQSARGLGDALGPMRIKVQQARDDGFLRLLLDSLDPDVRVALDFRHESWDDPEITARLDQHRVARVGALEGAAPFRYLRLREPPYGDDELEGIAATIRPLIEGGIDVYAYFRHEDEPTAPRYAEKLLDLT